MERETHDAVRRRGAADKALDLALLSMRSLVCLGAGDGRRPCRYKQQNTSVYSAPAQIDQHGRLQTKASLNSESLECLNFVPGTQKYTLSLVSLSHDEMRKKKCPLQAC